MRRKQNAGDAARADQATAARERDARRRILALGAASLPDRPWRPAPMPPSAIDLIQFALWRSSHVDQQATLAALVLLPAAHAELDELEAGLLFAARGAGLTWAQMAQAMGLRSPQACQQRYGRLSARRDTSE